MVDVVVVGAGPTGLVLAGELALAGVEVHVVERRSTSDVVGMRARGFHSRTVELFDQRGIADRFLAAGRVMPGISIANTLVDVSDLPTRHPYTLAIPQSRIEQVLCEWVAELGVPIHRGLEVVGFAQDEEGVDLHLAEGAPMRARYLVGTDGGRSTIRRAAGIDFPGWEATRSTLIAQVEVSQDVPRGPRIDAIGIHGLSPLADGRTTLVLVTEREVGPAAEPTLADLSAALVAVYGTDFGVHNPTSLSRFSDATRQAAAYRVGRVLLAGDAAHVHSPTGGQGVGLGVEDAVNLGWKLALVVAGAAPQTLLDTYEAERRPATARVLQYTMAMSATQREDGRVGALGDLLGELLSVDAVRMRLAALHLGLDVRHPVDDDGGAVHPLVGRRMPDLDVVRAGAPGRVAELMRDGCGVLLNLVGPGRVSLDGWGDRARLVEGACDGAWQLPVVGDVEATDAVLVRPDGHVAWVGDGDAAGLGGALERWFGPAATMA